MNPYSLLPDNGRNDHEEEQPVDMGPVLEALGWPRLNGPALGDALERAPTDGESLPVDEVRPLANETGVHVDSCLNVRTNTHGPGTPGETWPPKTTGRAGLIGIIC